MEPWKANFSGIGRNIDSIVLLGDCPTRSIAGGGRSIHKLQGQLDRYCFVCYWLCSLRIFAQPAVCPVDSSFDPSCFAEPLGDQSKASRGVGLRVAILSL